MKSLCLLCSFLFFITTLHAQQGATIRGSVKGSQGAPEKASVFLVRVRDSAVIKTVLTDKSGGFEFDKVSAGSYKVHVSISAQQTGVSQLIQISADQSLVTVPLITVSDNSNTLSEVKITSKRPLIETKLDKVVVNVENMLSSAGLSVLDLLEKAPGVTVDNNDNVQMKGKQGVLILIDGRPTHLSGQDLANMLRNMPSSNIEQMEVMTQPPARFDAAGNAGVINLKTKKTKAAGFNGSFTAGVIQAVYFKSQNSVNANYRKGKFNVFGNASYSYWRGFSENNIVRTFRDNTGAVSNKFDQQFFSPFKGTPLNIRVGVDYSMDKKTILGFSVNNLNDKRWQNSDSKALIYGKTMSVDSINYATGRGDEVFKNFSANLNFRRIIDTSGKELTGDLDYVQYTPRPHQLTDNYQTTGNGILMGSHFLLDAAFEIAIKIYSGKLDYTHAFSKTFKMDAGIKSSYVRSDNNAMFTYLDNGNWKNDTGRTNHFIYSERINAGYLNFSKEWKKFEMQAGLRAEQTVAEGRQLIKGANFDRDYFQLFPTAYFNYHLNEASSLGLSYGRRINRPSYQDLNPFISFIDKYTSEQGNPYLLPQFTHNTELTYSYKGQLTVTANYSRTTDIISDVLQQDDVRKITLQTKSNIAKSTNIGLAVSYNKQIKKWWTSNTFLNAYRNHFEGLINNKQLSVDAPAFTINTTNQFVFGQKGWGGELSAYFQSPRLEDGLIKSRSTGMFIAAVSKQVWNRKGTFRFALRDPFYLMRFKGDVRFDNLDVHVLSRWDNRRVILNFTYRFGKAMRSQPRRQTGSANDEQSRVRTGAQN